MAEGRLAGNRLALAFLIDTLDIGGTELNAFRTAGALVARGIRPRIYHLQESGPLLAGYRALALPLIHVPMASFRSPRSWLAMRRLGLALRREGVAVLHAHDLYSNIVALGASFTAGAPRLITSRRWWKVTPRPGLGALNRWAYRRSDRVLANSGRVGALLSAEDRVPDQKVVVVPNFLESEVFAPVPPAAIAARRAALGLPLDAPVIGIVARLAPVKDHRTLLAAFDLVHRTDSGAHLAIVGDGPEEGRLREQAGALAAAHRIHFLGALPNRPTPHALFDISVLCSTSEGFPNSIVEAMAAGKPVVATDVGGVRDAVQDGVSGMVVPPAQPEAIASALTSLLLDPASAERLGRTGRNLAIAEYGEAKVLTHLIATYQTLLEHPLQASSSSGGS